MTRLLAFAALLLQLASPLLHAREHRPAALPLACQELGAHWHGEEGHAHAQDHACLSCQRPLASRPLPPLSRLEPLGGPAAAAPCRLLPGQQALLPSAPDRGPPQA